MEHSKRSLTRGYNQQLGWRKGLAIHKEMWCWNISNSVIENCNLWKKWKQKNTRKEKFIEAK